MKTAHEIRAEVDTLRKMKLDVRHFTAFGNDNWLAIDRQIDALVDEWTDDDAYDVLDEGYISEHEFQAASEAIAWANGDYDEYEDDDGEIIDRPSLNWKSLVE